MAKPVPFASDKWVECFRDACNNSTAYQQAAKNWEGDFYFIVEPDTPNQDPIYMYLDLYHGQCRKAYIPRNRDDLNPEFSVSGSLEVWQAIAQKKIDPVKALLTRKLSVTGNMAKIMKNVKAANELVNCTTAINTEFPLDL